MMPVAMAQRLRRLRQRQESTRLRDKNTPRVTDAPPPAPESTLGRQESKPLVRECGWCSRVWNGSAWVTAPLGIDRRGFTTGLCGDCYHTHFGAYEHAHEAVAS